MSADKSAGKGPYVLLAVLVLIALVDGLLNFNGAPEVQSLDVPIIQSK